MEARPVGAAVSVTKALPGPAPQPLPFLLPLPARVPSPFSPRHPREWTKGGASGAQRAPEALEVQDCGAEEGLGSPWGERFTFCRPGGHGAGVPGRAKLLLRFAEGAGALPTPVKLFPGEGGGVSAAQAQRSPRPEAERLRGFVAGKSAWEQRSVWPIAGRCPAPDAHVVLPPQPTRPLPAPPWSFRAQAGRWGRPGAWDLGLHNAEGGTVGVWAGRESSLAISDHQQGFRTQLRAEDE